MPLLRTSSGRFSALLSCTVKAFGHHCWAALDVPRTECGQLQLLGAQHDPCRAMNALVVDRNPSQFTLRPAVIDLRRKNHGITEKRGRVLVDRA